MFDPGGAKLMTSVTSDILDINISHAINKFIDIHSGDACTIDFSTILIVLVFSPFACLSRLSVYLIIIM